MGITYISIHLWNLKNLCKTLENIWEYYVLVENWWIYWRCIVSIRHQSYYQTFVYYSINKRHQMRQLFTRTHPYFPYDLYFLFLFCCHSFVSNFRTKMFLSEKFANAMKWTQIKLCLKTNFKYFFATRFQSKQMLTKNSE